jgi:hypothetical protein
MKFLLLAIGTLLVIFGIVSANLWLDLRTERLENIRLTTQLRESSMAPRAPTTPVQPVATAAPSGVVDTPVATGGPAPLPTDNEAAMKATVASVSAGAAAAAKGTSDRELMKNPEFRKAQLTITRLRIAGSNPGLAETLGLSETEANDLFDDMAEAQMSRTAELSEAMAKAGGVGNASAMTEVLRNAAGREDPARAALGEARYAQYQEYQRNVRPALQQVASIGNSLDAAGQPLDDGQSRALTVAMLTEQQRLRQEAAMPRPNSNPGVPRGIADTLTESANRQQESNLRILEASASTLNAAQLEVLKQQFEQQDATRRRSIESAKEMDARRVTLPQPAIPSASAP